MPWLLQWLLWAAMGMGAVGTIMATLGLLLRRAYRFIHNIDDALRRVLVEVSPNHGTSMKDVSTNMAAAAEAAAVAASRAEKAASLAYELNKKNSRRSGRMEHALTLLHEGQVTLHNGMRTNTIDIAELKDITRRRINHDVNGDLHNSALAQELARQENTATPEEKIPPLPMDPNLPLWDVLVENDDVGVDASGSLNTPEQ